MRDVTPTPVSALENTMSMLSRTYRANEGRLTKVQDLMALTASAAATRNHYGPTPDTMQLAPDSLPEYVKGLLANYNG